MKKTILAMIALGILVVSIGCDPFGSEKTMTYITGSIYTDAGMTVPAEGVGVQLLVDPDSSAVRSQVAFTDASGVFFMEIQFYPFLSGDESGTGYSMPSTTTVGLCAQYNGTYFVYRSLNEGFLLSVDDTLTVWPIDLSAFESGSGKGGK